jgi:hypothetical protein
LDDQAKTFFYKYLSEAKVKSSRATLARHTPQRHSNTSGGKKKGTKRIRKRKRYKYKNI